MSKQIRCDNKGCKGVHKVSSVKNWDDTMGTYVHRCTDCNKKYARVWRIIQSQHNEFMQWMLSDNVIKVKSEGKTFWSSQDALYRNKLYTMLEAWNYYKKEFINLKNK